MRRLIAFVLVSLLAVPAAAALDRTQVRALVRIAGSASGLKARAQVRVAVEPPARFREQRLRQLDREYPRPALARDESVYRALGLTSAGAGVLRRTLVELEQRRGFYDPVGRTAHVRAGTGERATALHEIVHALQDQHYDLRRLNRLGSDTDARRAGLAAVEGHALLVANVLAKRSTSAHVGDKLKRFLELQRGFVQTVGLRFASDLRNLGGNTALLGALRRFPATSEQVFHLDKYLERERARPIVLPGDAGGLRLAGDATFGEIDVRALLAVFDVPRLDHAATGWGGGRAAVYRGSPGQAVLLALDWDTELDARQWAEAAATYVNEAFDAATPGEPPATPCAAERCWQLAGRSIAFARDRSRTRLVVGGDLDTAVSVALQTLGQR